MRQGPDELIDLVTRARTGDAGAFDRLVRRFQDRATALALARLGDLALAEDAAQEAFVEAYGRLPALRAPAAFPVWLRKIILKHCDRRTRGKAVPVVPLDEAVAVIAPDDGPEEATLRRERQEAVRRALAALSAGERAAVTLYYMGEHSHQEIAAFLGVPATTVKSRLHTARARLREGLIAMVQDDLQGARPSQDDTFVARVQEDITQVLARFAAGDPEEAEIRRWHPGARFRAPHPVFELTGSLLRWAVTRGATAIQLRPEANGLGVYFTADGVTEKAVTLPKSLQEPLTARLKDGANLDVTERNAPQEGVTPLHDSRDGRDYQMRVFCVPVADGEQITLRLSPAPAGSP